MQGEETQNPHSRSNIILAVALAAAWSDGSVCDNEKRALGAIMDHIGLSPEMLAQRLQSQVSPPSLESLEVPEDFAFRLELLRYAMAVSMADGSLESGELDFLRKLTSHLGVSPQALRILRLEAEGLAREQGEPGPESLLRRVQALLPTTGPQS